MARASRGSGEEGRRGCEERRRGPPPAPPAEGGQLVEESGPGGPGGLRRHRRLRRARLGRGARAGGLLPVSLAGEELEADGETKEKRNKKDWSRIRVYKNTTRPQLTALPLIFHPGIAAPFPKY